MASPVAARAYYAALDEGDYDGLEDLLTPDFVHDRPDRTLEGRDRFVQFVRDERPVPDTTHAIDAICRAAVRPERRAQVLARGRLLDGGDVIVRFCDAFTFADGRIAVLVTYTN